MRNDGMALEDEIFEVLKKMMDGGKLPWTKELCRLHRRKSYYSPVRKAQVNFENVIEVFTPDNVGDPAAKPTQVIFYECKDHGRNVEVGQIDEVVGRLGLSFGFAMKAYVVTRNAFSSGALATADSKGIGLIKLMPDEKVRYLMHFSTITMLDKRDKEFARRALRALLDSNYVSDGDTFYGMDSSYVFRSAAGMLAHHAGQPGLER